jgi:two-component system, NtrC family, sensor histidine kinase HydH
MYSGAKYIISFLVIVITVLHYITDSDLHLHHLILRELYFVPIAMAGLLLGLVGALVTSLSITLLYLPFVFLNWQGFSTVDIGNLGQVVLFNGLALILGVLRDRQRSEQKRLRESENLASIGSAMSSVAHDMKTPLIAIGGFSRQVQKDLDPKHPGFRKLEIVLQETRRLEGMMRDMLDFARPLQLERKEENLANFLRECISLVEEEAQKKKVSLQPSLDHDIPPVLLDAMRLKRAIINILTNAVQASPAGESVSIHTYKEGKRIVLSISNRGTGIPKEHMEKIFHPFFTTKKEGTGLGLPISKKILEAHGGDLTAKNDPQRGVTFLLFLPCD